MEDAYAVFAKYALGERLTVCHCNLCMAEEAERALVRTPLREIPADLLAEYTNSAHGYDDGPIADELRYFLPRYFELIALDQPPDHMGLDQCLRRLGESAYREKWPPDEAEVIDRFFDVFVRSSTAHLEVGQWPVGWLPAFQLIDAITMALTAGADVERVIRSLDGAPDPAAAVHLAVLRRDVGAGPLLRSAYLEEEKYRHSAELLGEWLLSPAIDARIEAAFFAVEDPRLQEILSKGTW